MNKVLLLLWLLPTLAWGQSFGTDTYTALYRDPIECRSAAATARNGQECLTTSTGARYICQTPASGGNPLTCDSLSEWIASGGLSSGAGTPGGSTTQLQYNNAGVFAGITGATTSNGSTLSLASPIITGSLAIEAGRLSYNDTAGRIAVGDGTTGRYLHPVLSAGSDCPSSPGARTAVIGEVCVDQDDGHLWMCKNPAAGGTSSVLCDTLADWESVWQAASEVPFTPGGTIAATNVQAAISEVASEAAGGQIASAVPFTPVGTIAATNVQAAIAEVATEAGTGTAGTLTDPTSCIANVTTATLGQLCTDLDTTTLWSCVAPAAGGASTTVCDDPNDWGATAPIATTWQAVMAAGHTYGLAVDLASAMKVGNDTLGIYEYTWADATGLHKQVSPADNYSTVIATGKNYALYRNDGTTALWTMTEAGALTLGSAVTIDNSAAAVVKPFRAAAGAAPSTTNTCSYDTTANRYKCGNGTVSNTLAWLSEVGAGTIVDDNINVGNGTTSQAKAVPTCTDTGGNHLNYDASTNTFSCGTSGSGGSAGTTVDDSLNLGNGTISEVKAVPTCTDTGGNHLNYNASTNAFSCGTSSSASGSATTIDDNLLIGNGTISEAKVLPSCTDTGGNHLNYNASTNTLSCGTSGGAGSFNGDVTGTFNLSGDITPTTLSANADDYAPTSLSTNSVVRVSSDKLVSITGLTGGADGRIIALVNIGTFPILLTKESTASTAANRFGFDSDVYLWPSQSVTLIYNSTSTRWRALTVGGLYSQLDPTTRFILVDEFMGGVTTAQLGWGAFGGGGGAQSCQMGASAGSATNKAIGIVQCDTGTANAGTMSYMAAASGNGAIWPGQGQMVFAWRVDIETLATSAEDMTALVGVHDASTALSTLPNNGIYFYYDRATAGDFWRIATASGGTRTVTTTSEPVTTQFIWLMAITNSDWTSVSFFARPNGQETWNYLGVSTTNMPTSATVTYLAMKINKTLGNAQRNISVDSVFLYYNMKR